MSGAAAELRELAAPAPLAPWVALLREAFGTVAAEFGWTEETVPTNAAFTSLARLEGMRRQGVRMFGLELDGAPGGFVAVEDAGEGRFHVERLAVLPRLRHAGLGRRLMDHALGVIRAAGGRTASIGVVNEHAVLKRWYEAQGFRETATRRFPHLPFTVCFMERAP